MDGFKVILDPADPDPDIAGAQPGYPGDFVTRLFLKVKQDDGPVDFGQLADG